MLNVKLICTSIIFAGLALGSAPKNPGEWAIAKLTSGEIQKFNGQPTERFRGLLTESKQKAKRRLMHRYARNSVRNKSNQTIFGYIKTDLRAEELLGNAYIMKCSEALAATIVLGKASDNYLVGLCLPEKQVRFVLTLVNPSEKIMSILRSEETIELGLGSVFGVDKEVRLMPLQNLTSLFEALFAGADSTKISSLPKSNNLEIILAKEGQEIAICSISVPDNDKVIVPILAGIHARAARASDASSDQLNLFRVDMHLLLAKLIPMSQTELLKLNEDTMKAYLPQ